MQMNKKTIRDIDLTGKRVLMRVDFNVPIENGRVTDATRIEAAVPTIQAVLSQNPRAVLLMSHLGRPKAGQPAPEFSLAPTAPVLAEKLGRDVQFVDDTVGDKVKQALENLPEGGVLILENTRFYDGEKKNDPEFSRQLAELGDVFVSDAFGSAHRAHASTVGVTEYLPSVAGLLMEKEIEFLGNAIANPARPFVAILGGAKISDKIGVIESLLEKADKILIGGGMANTFLAAEGVKMGESLVEESSVETAKDLMSRAGGKIVLPVDLVIADAFDENAQRDTIDRERGVPDGWRALDVGPETVKAFAGELAGAKTVVWNGPMGVFEMAPFAEGTNAIARTVADLADQGATVIIGGGDSAAAIQRAGLADRVTHVSTGGGASLEMLEGKVLPGLAALDDKE
ncbi:MAG TPA: phosphoglycerate kinase [Aggregatilineales bacterium]|nr:phosphoglycerate kinase [Aggregatilineales bacterium]HQA67246.1 phosphoglycerate kinase [Aggregatilineales bacterium]HQE17054.1 phosphoglycerate kinase [Aggregatilineales bacterium]